MVLRLALATALSATVLGCNARETVRIEFDLAQRPEAKTVILAFDPLPADSETYQRLLAVDLEAGVDSLELPVIDLVPDDGGAEAIALFLSDALDTIGLEAGPLEQPSDVEAHSTIEDLASRSFVDADQGRVEPGSSDVVWTQNLAATTLPLRFSETRLDPTCAKFLAINKQVNVCRNLAFITRVGPSQFLFGSRCQRFFLATVTEDDVNAEAIDSPLGGRAPDADAAVCGAEGRTPNEPGFLPKVPAIHSAHSNGAGSIAYGGLGVLYIHEAGRPPVTIELPAVAGEVGEEAGVFWLLGQPVYSREDFELFAMTAKGRVLRVTRTATIANIETLHDFQFARAEDERFGGIASSGDGHLVAVGPRSSQILVYQDSNARIIEGPTGMGFASVAHVPGSGIVLSAEAGRTFRLVPDESGGTLEAFPEPTAWSSRIESVAAFRGGFLIGGTNGFIGEFREGRGFCTTQQLASAAPRGMYALGEEGVEAAVFFVGGKEQSRDRNAYGLLRSR